jgi:hypothetical protein
MNPFGGIKNDIKLGGIIFTSFYIISTAIMPNVIMNKELFKMDKISIFFWFFLIILWQLYILYSFYKYFYSEPSEYDIITYKLFVEGGWYNFQKWLSFFAEDIFEDILFLAIVLLIPLNITENINRKNRVLLIFGKMGLFLLFTYFILGPPTYNITKQDLTPINYFNTIMKFKGDDKEGILNYLNINKMRIIKIISSLLLIILVYFKK